MNYGNIGLTLKCSILFYFLNNITYLYNEMPIKLYYSGNNNCNLILAHYNSVYFVLTIILKMFSTFLNNLNLVY